MLRKFILEFHNANLKITPEISPKGLFLIAEILSYFSKKVSKEMQLKVNKLSAQKLYLQIIYKMMYVNTTTNFAMYYTMNCKKYKEKKNRKLHLAREKW